MRAIGIILAGGNNERLGQLTKPRATSAMPVGSSYRAIDFPLSNMVNSGINKVAVITQYNSRSLHDHLASSKWWDFGRKKGGLFVFTPYVSNDNAFWFRGTADSMYQNLTYLEKSNQQYVVIASGDCIYKMDFNFAIDYHIEKGADITVVCKDMKDKDVRDYGVMTLDSDNRILEFEEKPVEPDSSTISLGIYIINRTLLMKMLESTNQESRYDFVKDILIRYRKKIKIYGCFYDGYWSNINSLNSYYNINMDFLDADIRNKFTKEFPYIATKPKDEPPAKYNPTSVSKNIIVGCGSILNGYAENSVLFRRVFTGENSTIKNSIIMDGCYIGSNCYIENAIFDKQVVISDGKRVVGTKENPVMVDKSTVL